ncbi:MAG: SHOCT domain-containing protein [Cyanobacteria bacterium J06632_22]
MTAKSTIKLPASLDAVTGSLSDTQRWQVALLAFVGAVQPTPIPLTFLHKLYLKQYGWSLVYLLLGLTQIARVACAIEGVWYVLGAPRPTLSGLTPPPAASAAPAQALEARAAAIRTLEQLRQDGLLSEYEFEQQRRQVLDLS